MQWLAAVESPPHLKAMVPAMTFSTPQNFFYSWGVWDLSWSYWIWANIAPDTRVKRNLPGPRTEAEARASWTQLESRMQARCRSSHSTSMRDVAPYYLEWLRHPPEDPFWSFAELRGSYGATDAAVLNLSGWHDDNYGPEGATTNFRGLVDARGGQPARAALLIGPWVHGVDATARTQSGEREFGPAAAIDYDAVVLDWMDRHVRGLPTATGLASPVRYFVMGANHWATAESWPPPARPRLICSRRRPRVVPAPWSVNSPGRRPRAERLSSASSSRIPTIRYAIRVRPRGRPRLPRRWSERPMC